MTEPQPNAPAAPATTPAAEAPKQKVRPTIKMFGVDVEAAEEVSQLIPLSQVAPELFAPPAKKSRSGMGMLVALAVLFAAAGSFAGYAWKNLQAERARSEQTAAALATAQTELAAAQTRATNAETRVRVLEGERETMVQDATAKATRIVELEQKLAAAAKKGRRR